MCSLESSRKLQLIIIDTVNSNFARGDESSPPHTRRVRAMTPRRNKYSSIHISQQEVQIINVKGGYIEGSAICLAFPGVYGYPCRKMVEGLQFVTAIQVSSSQV